MSKLAVMLLGVMLGCGGSPSGAVCPTADAPTYDNFGKAFMEEYCVGCHSRTAASRHGAPGDQNYDTEADVMDHADKIDTNAAAGPGATNTAMPNLSGPVHSKPTQAEREKLGQYLACAMSAP